MEDLNVELRSAARLLAGRDPDSWSLAEHQLASSAMDDLVASGVIIQSDESPGPDWTPVVETLSVPAQERESAKRSCWVGACEKHICWMRVEFLDQLLTSG